MKEISQGRNIEFKKNVQKSNYTYDESGNKQLKNKNTESTNSENNKKPSLAYHNKLSPLDFMGEAAALLQRPQKTQAFQFQPQFFQNYQVNFDNQRNALNASTRGIERQFRNNPAALAQLQANKLEQMNQINSQDFQQNQILKNDTLNKNVALANESQIQNNQYQQYAQDLNLRAEANTRRNQLQALGSIGNKVNFNKQQNNTIQMAEGLTNFVYNPMTGQLQYTGPQYKIMNHEVGMSNPWNTQKDNQKDFEDYQKFLQFQQMNRKGENGLKLLDAKYKNAFMFGGKMKKGKSC